METYNQLLLSVIVSVAAISMMNANREHGYVAFVATVIVGIIFVLATYKVILWIEGKTKQEDEERDIPQIAS